MGNVCSGLRNTTNKGCLLLCKVSKCHPLNDSTFVNFHLPSFPASRNTFSKSEEEHVLQYSVFCPCRLSDGIHLAYKTARCLLAWHSGTKSSLLVSRQPFTIPPKNVSFTAFRIASDTSVELCSGPESIIRGRHFPPWKEWVSFAKAIEGIGVNNVIIATTTVTSGITPAGARTLSRVHFTVRKISRSKERSMHSNRRRRRRTKIIRSRNTVHIYTRGWNKDGRRARLRHHLRRLHRRTWSSSYVPWS